MNYQNNNVSHYDLADTRNGCFITAEFTKLLFSPADEFERAFSCLVAAKTNNDGEMIT
jgi:hypothetical protein